uniref:Dolichol-phosphate mannosyltransferase subunit 3 n=1 Tax=Ditylenchus dipsaci TaxID=166011 RepID=A0A915EKE1_9BILA
MASQLQIYLTIASPFYFSGLWTQLLIGGPLLVVLTLGVYAASTVIYGVITFNDCTAAKQDLIKEISEAKADLRKRKIID